MRLPLQAGIALGACVAISALAGPPAAKAPARLAGEQACDITLNVDDPDPNVPIDSFENSSLNLAKSPKALLIASATLPVGSPPPLGFMQFQ
jgi:hypothetical protein